MLCLPPQTGVIGHQVVCKVAGPLEGLLALCAFNGHVKAVHGRSEMFKHLSMQANVQPGLTDGSNFCCCLRVKTTASALGYMAA
jgi:hypothetical protein